MAKQPTSNKLTLVCEECGCETEQLVIKKRFMYCTLCNEAKERRERFRREEAEWNRVVPQKETKRV